MRRYGLMVMLMLAGCAAPGGPGGGSPDMVQLREGQLTLRFIDGLVCRTPVDPGGQGRFADCPRPFTYQVAIRHPNALAASGLVEPFADITLTDPAGRVSHWRTPASRDWVLGPVLDD